MPWDNHNPKLLREEFVGLALQPGVNISQLCQRFNISRKTGYKWLHRAQHSTLMNFEDRSKRPHHIVNRIPEEVKERIITTRCLYPHWGAKKIKAYLINRNAPSPLPSIASINKILAREQLTRIHQHERHTRYKRFEHPYPNSLWQMDFKGYFSLLDGEHCHPLTIIDDYSRYLVCLAACHNEKMDTVKNILVKTFSHYGLPDAIALDNGACWKPKGKNKWCEFTIWLMRLGIHVIHGKPYYPQARGKNERLNRTLKTELINDISMKDFTECQNCFDSWRNQYNYIRPHEALELKPPITRYHISEHHFSGEPSPIQYWEDDLIRTIDENGYLYIARKKIRLTEALRGQPVAIRPSIDQKMLNIFFCQELMMSVKNPGERLTQGKGANHVTYVDV